MILKGVVLSILLLIFAAVTTFSDELLGIWDYELDILEEQIQKDGEEIDRLTDEKVTLLKEKHELEVQISELKAEIAALQLQDEEQMGVYMGGALAYPAGADAYFLYKFRRWGLLLRGGYSDGFSGSAGAVIKMK